MAAEEEALLRGVDEVGASVASSAEACRKFFFLFFFNTALQFHSCPPVAGGCLSLLRQGQLPVDVGRTTNEKKQKTYLFVLRYSMVLISIFSLNKNKT